MADSDDQGTRGSGPEAAPAAPAATVEGSDGAKTVGRLPETPSCPFCDGHETEIMNPFGSHASVATYWCRSCRCPFEMLKWR